uniref:Enteropeptidase n=1 Tax=Aceria tosichella TaxID=561515 RepID=A0A6G1SMB6_9ACAR
MVCSVNRKPTLIDPNMISALIGRHEISWWSLNIASSDVLFRAIIAPSDIDPCKPRIETDYVLLVTSNRMDLRQGYVSRVCLPERDDIKLDNIKGTIVGWGETYAGSGRSNILRWAEVIIQARELCRSAQPDLDPNKTLCALGDSGACQGDSGGPLMIKDQLDRWVQVGIYSAYVGNGGKCGPNMLMLFKRISSYWRWAIDTFNINELLDMIHIA